MTEPEFASVPGLKYDLRDIVAQTFRDVTRLWLLTTDSQIHEYEEKPVLKVKMLFGPADWGISPLTWAAQIDLTEGRDESLKDLEDLCRVYAPNNEWSGDFDVQHLAYICNLAKEVLGEIADSPRRLVSKEHLKQILNYERLLSSTLESYGYPADIDTENGFVPADQVNFEIGNNDSAERETARHIITELRGIFPTKVHLVQRCDECKFPFVRDPRRDDQRWCSQRCRQRVWIREKRREERQSKKAPRLFDITSTNCYTSI